MSDTDRKPAETIEELKAAIYDVLSELENANKANILDHFGSGLGFMTTICADHIWAIDQIRRLVQPEDKS